MLFRCSYCPMKTNLTLAQFPGKLYFWWEACPLLPACENKLAKDIELQRELKGLSKIARIHAHECELTHKCVWLERSVDHYSNGINKCGSVGEWQTKYLQNYSTRKHGSNYQPISVAVGTWTPIFSAAITMETLCVLLHIFSQAGTLAVSVCVFDGLLLSIPIFVLR